MGRFISKKILINVWAVILILLAGILIGFQMKGTSDITPIQNNTAQIAQGISDENGSKADSSLVKVARVIDGDTIEIEGGEKGAIYRH